MEVKLHTFLTSVLVLGKWTIRDEKGTLPYHRQTVTKRSRNIEEHKNITIVQRMYGAQGMVKAATHLCWDKVGMYQKFTK